MFRRARVYKQNDVFLIGRLRKLDMVFFGIFYLLLGLLYIFNQIQTQSSSSYGGIYFPIFIIGAVLLIGAAAKVKQIGGVVYGRITSSREYGVDMLWNLGLGGLFIGLTYLAQMLIGAFTGFSLLPFSVTPLAAPFSLAEAAALIPELLVVSVIAPVQEQVIGTGILFPTFARLVKNGLFTAAMVLGFVVFFSYALLQPGFWVLAAVCGIMAVVSGMSYKFREFLSNPATAVSIGIGLYAIILATYHIYAYGNTGDLYAFMFNAGVFFIFVGAVDHYKQNIMGSIMIHSMYNTYMFVVLSGLPLAIALIGPVSLLCILGIPFLKEPKINYASYSGSFSRVSPAPQYAR